MKKVECRECFHQYSDYLKENSKCGMRPPDHLPHEQWDDWRLEYTKKMTGTDCEDYVDRKMMNDIFDGIMTEKQEEMACDLRSLRK